MDLLGLADNFLDPKLELHEHLFHPWGVLESGSSSILPIALHWVVVVIIVVLPWSEVMAHLIHVGLLAVPHLPELLSHALASEVVEVFFE